VGIVIFKVYGNNPYQILSRKDFYYNNTEWVVDIGFILNGKLQILDRKESVGEFHISNWKIIYPVKRRSFRRYNILKSYLTIYDFDWSVFIKNIFNMAK
jgi:hypothetical protein